MPDPKRRKHLRPLIRLVITLLSVLAGTSAATAQTHLAAAPGGPGKDAQWETAAKNGVGTSTTLDSRVWFTLSQGALTEVYYPTLDTPNTRILQFLVVNAKSGLVETEQEDTLHRMELLDARSLSFRQFNTSKRGDYTIIKSYTSDPQRHTILISVRFKERSHGSNLLYVYYDPSLNNSGMHDSAWTEADALLASDQDKASALVSNARFSEMTNGFFGTSDGLTQLKTLVPTGNTRKRSNRHPEKDQPSALITHNYNRASDGNVVQVARVKNAAAFTLALGFGNSGREALRNARASLAKGFKRNLAQYETGWHKYLSGIRKATGQFQRQFDVAAMTLKAHEDKTHRGATVASLSIPWGGGANANEPNISGYHAVWSRDLYEVATALDAIGDHEAAGRALDYLFNVQQRSDGSFPQNSRVDGRQLGGGLQMDEVAFPLILAYQLGRMDRDSWLKHIKPGADFILRKGPGTEQERWEEKSGFSPSTIAAEVAGLVCAAEIARLNGDRVSSEIYLKTADGWATNIERWTATTTGPYGDGNYYLRITAGKNPDNGEKLEINSGGGIYDERLIVDAGFLELVRLGIRPPNDPVVIKSLSVVDKLIRVETPRGSAWYRYNHDAYGETLAGAPYDGKTGKGRLWTLLTGERGEYELASGRNDLARALLLTLARFANDGMMIPEQVWDEQAASGAAGIGRGTGSATPLAWSMAQFLRLAVNIREGRNVETPDLVRSRYSN